MKRGIFTGSTAFVLLLGLIFLWLPWLGIGPFDPAGENGEAAVATSMLQSGDWILPTDPAGSFPANPPFVAWLIAVFAWLLNGGVVNEFVARLPSALAAIGMCFMGYVWAKSHHDRFFAMTFALVTATSYGVYHAAAVSDIGMVSAAAMVGAIYVIYEIRERQGRDNVGWYSACAGLLTAATLTSGPVGALLPCLCGLIYLICRHDNILNSVLKMLLLMLVSFVLPTLWYYAAWKRGGQPFLDMAFGDIGCLFGAPAFDSQLRPFFFGIGSVIVGMLPWTLLAVLSAFRWRTWHKWPFKPAGLISTVAALTVIVFYCFPSRKSASELLPAYPFMAYGITVLIDSLRGSHITRFFGRLMAFFGIFMPIAVALVELVPNNFFPDYSIPGWYSWIAVALPVGVTVWWLFGKTRSEVAMPVVWALYVALSALL